MYTQRVTAFLSRLSVFLAAHKGEWSESLQIGKICTHCLPKWLSDKLADMYQSGELECPASVDELSQQILEMVQDPKLALKHIVKNVDSWQLVQPGDDQAELDLVYDFLDLYELSSYYQVEDAFLTFAVLEVLIGKITMKCCTICITSSAIT